LLLKKKEESATNKAKILFYQMETWKQKNLIFVLDKILGRHLFFLFCSEKE
jgi:hypothetical protein